MIIECDNCNTNFRLDDSKLGPRGVKVKCTKCQHVFIVRTEGPAEEPPVAPPEEKAPEEERFEFGLGDEGAPEDEGGEEGEEEKPSVSSEETEGSVAEEETPQEEGFEFGFGEEEAPEGEGGEVGEGGEEETPSGGPSLEIGAPSGEGLDLGSEEETPPGGEGEKEEKPSISFEEEEGAEVEEEAPAEEEKLELGFETEGGEEPAGEGAPEEFELGFEEETPIEGEGEEPSISFEEESGAAVEEEAPQEEEELELGFEDEMPHEQTPEEETRPPDEKTPSGADGGEEETIVFSIGEEEETEPEEAGPSEGLEAPPEAPPEPASEPAPEPEEKARPEQELPEEEEALESLRKKAGGWKITGLLYLVLVLVIAASGGLLHRSGVVDNIIRKVAPPKVSGALEIEKLEGLFADNKHFGRVFALEGRIKNTSEEPQEIQAVKGVIYNKEGVLVSSRLVSPGRIVSKEELKTLPKEDILKHFKALSAGFVPPKGTIPIMVVFPELPPDMAEAEIVVIR